MVVVCGGLTRDFEVVCGGLWWFAVVCGGLSYRLYIIVSHTHTPDSPVASPTLASRLESRL